MDIEAFITFSIELLFYYSFLCILNLIYSIVYLFELIKLFKIVAQLLSVHCRGAIKLPFYYSFYILRVVMFKTNDQLQN